MDIVIAQEAPDTADVVELLEAHLEFTSATSPAEHVHALDLESLLDPAVTVCTARLGGELLGVGALRDLGDARAELKSMHTSLGARGRGVGRLMADHLVELARTRGIDWVGLETGSMVEFEPARHLYESMGFVRCLPFGSYSVNPYSVCMSLQLGQDGDAVVGDAKSMGAVDVEASGFRFTCDLGGDPDGDLVLFLHGFPQTRHAWRAELGAAASDGFRVCAPDQRGYSAGARPIGADAYRVELLVADVLAIADALDEPRFHLVGHDWGGHIAWLVAALHPERVVSLAVLSRPHPAAFARAMAADAAQSGRSGHHRSFQRPEATDELLADDAASLRSIYTRSGVSPGDADAYLATLAQRPALDAAVNWYRSAGASSLVAADVPAVVMPTMYVWGTADSTVGRAAAEATADEVTGPYRFVALADVGHFITDESPGTFPPLLLEHLRDFRL